MVLKLQNATQQKKLKNYTRYYSKNIQIKLLKLLTA